MNNPPRLVAALLRLVLFDDPVGGCIRGDLEEEYRRRVRRNVFSARWWYRREALSVVGHRCLSLSGRRSTRGRAGGNGGGGGPGKGDPMFQVLLREIRYAARTLARAPRFTVVAVLTLALGIGANTAIFSTVNTVLLKPLPYPASDRIVGLWHGAPELGYDQFGISPGLYYQYASENQVYEATGLYWNVQLTVTEDGEAEQLDATASTGGLFDVLGVQPLLGRTYTEEESREGGPAVAVLSYDLWQRRYGGDTQVVGQTIRLDGGPNDIIGVMPRGFDFGGLNETADLWIPLHLNPETADPGSFSMNALALLKPGVTPEVAEAQMEALILRVREQWADVTDLINFMDAGGFHAMVHTLKSEMVGNSRAGGGNMADSLWILMGTVGFVLLIACANVANLFLVRAEGRQRELAVRAALGATRQALVRQFLLESLLLAGVAGVLGLVVAWLGVPALLRLAPPELPRLDEVTMDGSVLAFTGGVTLVAALLFGAVPAFRYNLAGLLTVLRYAGRGTTEGRERHYLRNLLVVGQTALAMILLVGSGLLLKSFREIRQTDPGFDTSGILTFRVSLPSSSYPGALQPAAFHDELLDRIRAMPGVEAAGGVTELPLSGSAQGTGHALEDFPTEADELPPIFWYKFATPGYFEAMGIDPVAGRTFEPRDHQGDYGNVIVSQALAQRYWPGDDALGKRIRFAWDTAQGAWGTIVGITESVRDRGLREDPSQTVYRPMVSFREDEGWNVPNLTYVVRAENPTQLVAPIRDAIRAIDPNLPVAGVQTMASVVSNSMVRLTFTALALGIAAIMALILGAVGLYGVLSYVVAQRTQEIGVRMAVGAQAGQVLKMVVASGAKLALGGLVIGVLGAVGLTRLLQGLLYGTEPLDVGTFGATALLLLLVGLVASYLPARRASRVDPVRSMRVE